MSLPLNFGTRGRVTPTRSQPAEMPILEMKYDEALSVNATSGSNAIDGDYRTYAHLGTQADKLIIDFGNWYQIKSVLVVRSFQNCDCDISLYRTQLGYANESVKIAAAVTGNDAAPIEIAVSADQKFHRWLEIERTTVLGDHCRIFKVFVSTA